MRITEGFLPVEWCIFWIIISLIFIVIGIIQMKRTIRESPESKKIFTINGIFIFIISLLKIPIVTGTSSHPIGSGLNGSLFGPAITSVIVAIVLFLQVFLLGYGGITTIGADIFSIGIVGPFVAYLVYYGFKKIGLSPYLAIFVAAFLCNIFACVTTAIQYGLAYGSMGTILILSLIGQLPFAIIDTIITTVVFVGIADIYKYSDIFDKELEDYLSLK